MRRQKRLNRGFTMAIVMAIVVLLLLTGLAMLTNAQYSALSVATTEQKNMAFDAANAGLNAAMDNLDGNILNGLTFSGSGSSTFTNSWNNGASYAWQGTRNPSTTSSLTVADYVYPSNNVYLPPQSALLESVGTAPDSRKVTVEAVVKTSSGTIQFPNDAIDAGVDIDGNWNSGNCIGVAESSKGAKDANIHANGNIPANSCFVNGVASASGSVTGTVNANSTQNNAPQVPIPNMGPFIAYTKSVAKTGGNNKYINPAVGGTMPTSFSCPNSALPNGCVVFYDGSFSMAAKTTLNFTGRVILVINGNYTSTGQSSLNMQSGTNSILAVNGNADVGGNGSAAALIWSNGDTTLHGNGFVLGAVVAKGSVHFKGGGNGGGLQKDANLKNVTYVQPGKVTIISYAEY